MRQVMAKNVVPDDVIEASTEVIEPRESRFDVTLHNEARAIWVAHDSREGEDLRLLRIDFEIDGDTSIKNIRLPYVRGGVHSRFASCLTSTL